MSLIRRGNGFNSEEFGRGFLPMCHQHRFPETPEGTFPSRWNPIVIHFLLSVLLSSLFHLFFFCCLLYSYFSVGLSRVYSFFLRYCLACTVRFSTRSKAEWIVPFHCDGQLMENVSQDERYELLFANNQSSSFSLTKCIIW